MRAGVWYRALPRIDRVLVDLTIKVADKHPKRTLSQKHTIHRRKVRRPIGKQVAACR